MAATPKSWKMSIFRILQSSPYKAPTAPVSVLRASQCVEEERAPHYDPKHFYPVQLHMVLADRYQVAAKLGWGISSTVWLAKDLHRWRWLPPRYVAVKVNANNYASNECAEKELRITQHITQANLTHEGRYFVRTLLDSFETLGPHGSHKCMVFEPLGEPLWMLKNRFQGATFPPDVLRMIIRMVVSGLHYLHTQAHIIHTDLKSDNILMALRDQSVLDIVARDELEDPLPQKKCEDRTIYLSRNDFGFQADNIGRPVIMDFGLSVCGERSLHGHTIQPQGFRAPEVVIGAGWDYSVDIWNLGALTWELLCGTGPFDYTTSSLDFPSTEEQHLARIISLIGSPPQDLLRRGSRSSLYFNDGQFKFPDLIPQPGGFENKLAVMEGKERRAFIAFISKMLTWRPEERATAEELLSDPWLQA